MGSSVVSGTAKALVFATGRKAQLGSIASALQKPPPPTAFAVGIQKFGLMIVQATVFLVLFVLLINLLFHRPLLESFLFALALAVGLTPELLPMIVSVTLSHGALRMSRKQVIVKRLSAIDDLGSMDVLCSDKTGTLTEAHIKLVREVDLHGQDSDTVMRMAQINAAFETGLKSPLDEAILAAGNGRPRGVAQDRRSAVRFRATPGFGPRRRREAGGSSSSKVRRKTCSVLRPVIEQPGIAAAPARCRRPRNRRGDIQEH